MLRHIIRNEILANISSPAFLTTFVLCSLLILMSVYTGVRSYRDQVADTRLAQSMDRDQLSQQKDYRQLLGMGVQVSKPPKPLSIFVTGLEDVLGRHTRAASYFSPQTTGSKVEGNPIFAIFGTLDLMFITKTVLSLLAILFSYNLISGSKEDGSLRLTLSNSVPRDKVVLGKVVGGLLCLVVPLGIPILLGLSLLSFFPDVQLSTDEWLRLLVIQGFFILYVTFFFSLGIFVSSRTYRSRTSLLILLALWVVFTLVIPKGSVILAGQFVEVPSIQEHRMRVMQMHRDTFTNERFDYRAYTKENPRPGFKISNNVSQEERERLVAKNKEEQDAWSKKMREVMGEHHERLQVKLEEKASRLEVEFEARQKALSDLAIGLSRVSPAAAMTYASMNIAGTGSESHEEFLSQSVAYREQFLAYIESKTGGRSPFFQPVEKSAEPLDLSDMPSFSYQAPDLGAVVTRSAADLLLLSILTIGFFAGGYVSFLQYDVR